MRSTTTGFPILLPCRIGSRTGDSETLDSCQTRLNHNAVEASEIRPLHGSVDFTLTFLWTAGSECMKST